MSFLKTAALKTELLSLCGYAAWNTKTTLLNIFYPLFALFGCFFRLFYRVWSSLYSGLLGCCSTSLVFAAPLVVAGALVAPVPLPPPVVTVRFSWQALMAVSRPLCCPSTALRKYIFRVLRCQEEKYTFFSTLSCNCCQSSLIST